jgi:CHAT domain-containing protein
MRAATLTIEPAASALHVRLDVPERDVGEALVREFRQRVDAATLRALEESAGTLFHGRARFADAARRTGAALYRTLVPEGLRDDLRAIRAPLVVASSLTGIPWELVHDGDEFWGLRYALGTRLVLDRSAAVRPATRGARPRALVIGADPAGDLPHLAGELDAVCDALETRAEIVCVAHRLASLDRVLTLLGEGFDVVHFAGHVVTDEADRPALLLGDGRRLPASVVEANLVGRPLVYVNGCASAHAAAASASVAHAFLHGGALAVVGTVADVADDHAATLATTFYREALGGAPLGNALREARAQVSAWS